MVLSVLAGISGCGDVPEKKLPFQYVYKSAHEVDVTYQGKVYSLNQYKKTANTPFSYTFENDGDVDITVNGKTYEVDSPYDVDRKALKKSTSKVRKKSSKKR